MIKRYEESASGMIEDDEDGTYVDYFAYLELEAENAKLKDYLAEHQSAGNLYDIAMNRLEAENKRLRDALLYIEQYHTTWTTDELATEIAIALEQYIDSVEAENKLKQEK